MRYLWVSLLLLVVLGAAFGPAIFAPEPPADEQITIISPHWAGIRREFERAFADKYLKDTGKHIHVTWLDLGGGTGEIKKYLVQKFSQAKTGEGVGTDILFGGGMDILPPMAESNYFEPYTLTPEQINDLPETLNGQILRDKKSRYFSACLSTFGFVRNKLVLEKAALPAPQAWEDLGAPAFQGWVSCADPASSGSLHMAFELVLQAKGWEKGYVALARMIANTNAFNDGGSSIPRDVSLGQEAAGPCIDFYASAPVRRQGATHLEFVLPQGTTVATPDCLAMLRSPPNRRAASAFMNFVLSEQGQRLWYQARGTEGGPVEYDLERLPTMPRIYEMGLKTYTVVNPFKSSIDFLYDGKKGSDRFGILNDLWHAALIDVHDSLLEAHKAVLAANRDSDLGMALCRPPFSEKALMALAKARLPADVRNTLRNKWSGWARTWFAQIESAAKNNTPVPEFTPAPEN